MKSPIEVLSIILILLLIAGTWILYKRPAEEKEKITINSIRDSVPAGKSSAFIIHKP